MKPELFVFLGRSGCGKGTQTALLSEYLKAKTSQDVFYVATGDEFRKFMQTGTYTANEAKRIIDAGNFVPSFLASMMWANVIAREFKENTHMIIDGSPRTLAEKSILDTIFYFYDKPKVFDFARVNIVFMNVSKEWATEKLLKRARHDDEAEAIGRRMGWFEEAIVPIIELYKKDPKVVFHEINGEQAIDDVHKEIISKIFNS